MQKKYCPIYCMDDDDMNKIIYDMRLTMKNEPRCKTEIHFVNNNIANQMTRNQNPIFTKQYNSLVEQKEMQPKRKFVFRQNKSQHSSLKKKRRNAQTSINVVPLLKKSKFNQTQFDYDDENFNQINKIKSVKFKQIKSARQNSNQNVRNQLDQIKLVQQLYSPHKFDQNNGHNQFKRPQSTSKNNKFQIKPQNSQFYMLNKTLADKRKNEKQMETRALQEVPFNDMHNRSHYPRAEKEDEIFFDDIQGQNKNHLQSYQLGCNMGNQNHHPHNFGQGPTLQKPTFSRATSKKVLSCTNANSVNRQHFYTNRNSQAAQKPQGAPQKNSARYLPSKQTGTRLQTSSSTTSFQNQNQGSMPIGPRKSTMKNSQCIIASGHTNGNGMLTQRSESNQYHTHRGVRKSGTLNMRSNKVQQDEENQNVISHRKMKSYAAVPSKTPFQVAPMQLQESFDSTPMIQDGDIMMANQSGPFVHACSSTNSDSHPSKYLSREHTNEIQRQNINVRADLAEDIDKYLRQLETNYDSSGCLNRHKVTPALRARMVDWMIEVLTNFRCDDQTFFLAINLLDRYFKNCIGTKEVSDLHVTGVTTMFIASKFEDIYPLKMKTVFEKIAHKKLEISKIKSLELDIMKSIEYKIHAPTVLDFLKVYLVEVLGIEIQNRTETKKKEENALAANAQSDDQNAENGRVRDTVPLEPYKVQQYLIEKMAIYLAKMSMHDLDLSSRNPSLLAVGAIYVALKICEQLKKKDLINAQVVTRLIQVSRMGEDQILDVSQKVLYLAQNFDKEFPGLENLKKTHFGIITQLL